MPKKTKIFLILVWLFGFLVMEFLEIKLNGSVNKSGVFDIHQ